MKETLSVTVIVVIIVIGFLIYKLPDFFPNTFRRGNFNNDNDIDAGDYDFFD
ncbi:hypothetical protein [uncultured Kordia sp.]|uniref:hypothetical protein n=1 Tax=uncultured Kordia sp. TaxID=507699 RepID=UPI0026029755|nr:hypothetical protein [uncultured Kordia sp.]